MSIASELAKSGDHVTLIGSGPARPYAPYHFHRAPSLRRERFEAFPRMPLLRSDTVYEEASFVPGLLSKYRPSDFDITATCSYPFTNWALRRPAIFKPRRPPHVFITQNGDWPACSKQSEYRYFGCDGLVCTNPDYFDRNKQDWNCTLIPNGADVDQFRRAQPDRARFGLPDNKPVILMVSALIETKRVAEGIAAVASLPDAHLIVAGDGPLRNEIDQMASIVLRGRFTRISVPPQYMPRLYRSADVFLHMSKEESFGNVFVEAMASGLPIVGHETPRLRWIVGAEEELVDTAATANVTAGLAKALQEMDTARGHRIERAAGFSWKIVADQYRAFFQSVIATRKSHAG